MIILKIDVSLLRALLPTRALNCMGLQCVPYSPPPPQSNELNTVQMAVSFPVSQRSQEVRAELAYGDYFHSFRTSLESAEVKCLILAPRRAVHSFAAPATRTLDTHGELTVFALDCDNTPYISATETLHSAWAIICVRHVRVNPID